MENKIATLIRIDDLLYEEIKILAEKNKRSINKQIEYILEKYVDEQKKED